MTYKIDQNMTSNLIIIINRNIDKKNDPKRPKSIENRFSTRNRPKTVFQSIFNRFSIDFLIGFLTPKIDRKSIENRSIGTPRNRSFLTTPVTNSRGVDLDFSGKRSGEKFFDSRSVFYATLYYITDRRMSTFSSAFF